jgi:dolichol kinase
MEKKIEGKPETEGVKRHLSSESDFKRESEILRQLVHLSGLFFIALAQFIDKMLVGILFMLAAFLFLVYSEYVSKCGKNHNTLLSRIECKLRDFAFMLERKESKRPFAGAFWFYFGAGLAFLLFPLNIASVAGATLAISDSLSTIIGKKFGRHIILGKKTFEGSTTFFVAAFFVCLFLFSPFVAIISAVAATLAELLPEWKIISKSKFNGLFDDNLLIPIMTGLAISLAVI